MIKTMKDIKRFFLFIVVFLLTALSFACSDASEPIVLETPKVSINENGLASWKKVENANSYLLKINDGDSQEYFELEVQLIDGDTISVKAVSNDSKYADSEYSSPLKYTKQGETVATKLSTPVLNVDKNGLVKWEKVEGATSYNISKNGSNEYVNVTDLEYQLEDLDEITVCAVSDSSNYTNSDFSSAIKFIKTTGDGTKDNPYTVLDAIKLVNNKYNDGNISEEEFYFSGTISGTPYFTENNANFDLVNENEKISAFNIDKNNNEIGANSKVLVLAKLQNYGNTKPELINGKVISSENESSEVDVKTIKELLELGVSDVQYQIKGTVKNIANTLYGNFDLVDGESKVYVYGLLTKELESKKFESLNINEGDILTIVGNLSEYNGNVQIKNAVFVKVEKINATIIVEECENGTISEIDKTVLNGTTIKFVVTPNEGYVIKNVYANDKELETVGDNTYEFVVNGDTTIKAEFVQQGIVLDVTKKYTFSDYAAGEQYAKDEKHDLDENVSVSTTESHFTKELRLYSSSTHNGFAIFTLSDQTKAFKGLKINAGYKLTVLGVYGSNDGKNYELIASVAVDISYKEYTVDFKDKYYQYIKLDPTLDLQVRIKDITITYGEPKKHEHDYGSTWKYDDDNHYYECLCGEKKDVEKHNFEWVVDKEPTDNETGIKHEECSICHYKKNEGTVIQSLSHVHEWIDATCEEAKKCKTCGETEGEPLGHDYDHVNISWKWSAYSNVVATVTCKRDASHVYKFTAKVISKTIKEPTCAEYGKTMYSARITLNGIDYADIKLKDIPKTYDHYYEDGECIICHKELTEPIFTKVTSISQLNEGDKIVIVSESNYAVATAMGSSKFLNANEYTSSVESGNPVIITLNKDGSYWVLSTEEGLIGTSAAKTMKINGGTTTWDISFDKNGDAVITSTDSSCGKILYNVRNPRFLNYTSSTNASMLLPQIYKYTAAKCQHKFGSLHTEVPATCTQEGVKAYYTCSVCNKNYDKNGKLLKDLTIAKLKHNYENGECSICHKIDPSAHNLDFENIVWNWTEYSSAVAVISCKDNDGAQEIIEATITSDVVSESTCSVNGVKKYTASFEYEGKTYTNTKDEKLPLKQHNCNENKCSICNKELSESEILSALFALDKDETLSGTYKLTGIITKINTAYSTQYKNVTVTIKVGDKLVECYRLKGDGVENLAVCDEITVVGKLKDYNGKKEFDTGCTPSNIVASKHQFGALITGTDATHTETGIAEHYHCEICNKDFDKDKKQLTTTVIPASGHDKFEEGTWKTDENVHYHLCSCGDKVDLGNHDFEWVIDTPATTSSTGVKHEECKVCHYKRSEGTIIDKLTCDHTYDVENIVWTWANDFSSAKAKFVCTKDSSHFEEVDAIITSTVTKDATCEQTGVKTYTASVVFNGTTYKKTKEEVITGTHNFANGKCVVCKTEGSAFEKVTDISSLSSGDVIALVCESKNIVASSFSSSYLLSSSYSKYVDEAININLITLSGSVENGWILSSNEGIIESDSTYNESQNKFASNKLKLVESATSSWNVSFDENDNAVISTEISGVLTYLKYNSGSPRFTNYGSGQSDIQIYKFTGTLCSHNYGTLVSKVDSTCKDTGLEAHYKCSICDRYFDENKNEVTYSSLVIKKSDTHTDLNNDGVCDICNENIIVSGERTVTLNIADYADANSWSNSTKYSTIAIDSYISVAATGKTNTGKYYTKGEDWRIYQNESPSITFTATGCTIVSIKITYNIDKTGVLTYNSNNIDSGSEVEINATSATFGVGNTGTATNGQVKITAIEVVYALN